MIDRQEQGNGFIGLAGAVIKQAIADARLIKSKDKQFAALGREAYDFLFGKGLEIWCNILGLECNYIRAKMKREYKHLTNTDLPVLREQEGSQRGRG